jgi:poly(3-hydroxybutyrate) depolymerase
MNGRGGVTGAAGSAVGGSMGTAGAGAAGTTGAGGRAGGGGAIGAGGRAGAGGTAGTTGVAGTTGAGGAIPLKNPPVPSAGCGKPTTVTNGKKTITSSGQQRTFIIDIPTNYDMNKPYRFFYASHWISSNAEAVVGQNYYFLKPLATAANDPAIFLAPQALPGDPNGTWDTTKPIDQILFDDILAYVKQNLCIDTTRVFATGFSYGGMMTYSLSATRQKDIRAAVGIAPANYNIYVGTKTHEPIAWMQTTGMSDTTCPWVNGTSTTQGAKYIAIEHGTDNGCTVPATIPTWQSGAHVCYDFTGCRTEFPTKACTFNGPHTNINSDPGSSANWIPAESWKFFTQF